MENVDGKIAAILSPTKVVINRGLQDGVEEGDSFYIYTELGPFSDPDTNENLGKTTEVWGKVKVNIIEERFCVAETGYKYKNSLLDNLNLAGLFGGTSVQIKLPVREDQIQSGLTKIEVGFLARLEKRKKSLESGNIEELVSKPKELTENSGIGDYTEAKTEIIEGTVSNTEVDEDELKSKD